MIGSEAGWLTWGAAIALVLAAVYTDCRWRIIPNRLTIPVAAAGLLLNFAVGGWGGLWASAGGLLAGAGLMLIPFIFGQMGGGDVKFMGALGALLGGAAIVNIFLYTTLAGGVMAMIVIAAKGEFTAVMRRVGLLIKGFVLFRFPAAGGAATLTKSTYIPYGVAIGAGTLCFLIIGKIV